MTRKEKWRGWLVMIFLALPFLVIVALPLAVISMAVATVLNRFFWSGMWPRGLRKSM